MFYGLVSPRSFIDKNWSATGATACATDVSPRSFIDKNVLDRLQKASQWNEGKLHEIEYRNFSGGFFLDPRLPHTITDCLYQDTVNELLVLMHGSLYNREDLHRDCHLVGSDITDPALVAQLFLVYGPDMVARLNGDFAIVVYHARNDRLYIFRDHLGNVPVVYTTIEQAVYFSTDTIALCRACKRTARINMDPLVASYKPVDLTLTPNDSVLMLKPGHWLAVDEGLATVQKYWEPERIRTDNTLTQEQVFTELKALLEDSVRIRADQQFRAGTHLSGGLDSSLVAVIARKAYAHQPSFYGYSWTPDNAILPEGELDERDLIRQIGNMADINPVFIHVEPHDFIESTKNSLHNYLYFQEEKVVNLAKAHETNLLFSGWGGDEFFSIGSTGTDVDLVLGGDWKSFFKRNPLSDPKKAIKYFIFRALLPAIGYLRPSVKKEYYRSDLYFFKKEYRTLHLKTLRAFNCYSSRREFHLSMLYTYHISERTGPWCVTGYKNGVVYRYPLLDKRIIEYMLKVPSRLLVKDGKFNRIIPREISAGLLPETVRWRANKNDPAAFSLINQQLKQRALLFIDEVSDFKANPDLYFIDFDLLERAIEAFKQSNYRHDEANLFGQIIMLKFLHEFTKSYQEDL